TAALARARALGGADPGAAAALAKAEEAVRATPAGAAALEAARKAAEARAAALQRLGEARGALTDFEAFRAPVRALVAKKQLGAAAKEVPKGKSKFGSGLFAADYAALEKEARGQPADSSEARRVLLALASGEVVRAAVAGEDAASFRLEGGGARQKSEVVAIAGWGGADLWPRPATGPAPARPWPRLDVVSLEPGGPSGTYATRLTPEDGIERPADKPGTVRPILPGAPDPAPPPEPPKPAAGGKKPSKPPTKPAPPPPPPPSGPPDAWVWEGDAFAHGGLVALRTASGWKLGFPRPEVKKDEVLEFLKSGTRGSWAEAIELPAEIEAGFSRRGPIRFDVEGDKRVVYPTPQPRVKEFVIETLAENQSGRWAAVAEPADPVGGAFALRLRVTLQSEGTMFRTIRREEDTRGTSMGGMDAARWLEATLLLVAGRGVTECSWKETFSYDRAVLGPEHFIPTPTDVKSAGSWQAK
ncbi:MAG: hypothetical protein L0216_11010, partial [Planctomycetales bacterium]|nr:hypothetical protein [Planctomycetales bacterium]